MIEEIEVNHKPTCTHAGQKFKLRFSEETNPVYKFWNDLHIYFYNKGVALTCEECGRETFKNF
jgi:hypothetical protein